MKHIFPFRPGPGSGYSGRFASVFILILSLHASAQEVLFPGLEGEDLAEAIWLSYTPGILLTESDMRDTLYRRVFLQADSVHCIYSGLARHLPSWVDPSQWLYGTGQETGSLNLEHAWPQSKGADKGAGHRNMHHLYPSRSAINGDRGNDPYGDIPDHLTQKWYRQAVTQGSLPVTEIDDYSEYRNGAFEPREPVKGDIARAMFYFWTIYRENAVSADPQFFSLQRTALCAWHELDPADGDEQFRNEIIATYQGGMTNPFIDDCSLALRAYCPELSHCAGVSSSGPAAMAKAEIQYVAGTRQYRITGPEGVLWHTCLLDLSGRTLVQERLLTGTLSISVDAPAGLYLLQAVSGRDVLLRKIFIP